MENREIYEKMYKRSIKDRDAFWREQAELIHWEKPFETVLEYDNPPFANWYPDGETNLCYNAVDRHVAERGDQDAIIWVSTEVEQEKTITYNELYRQVNEYAALLRDMGVAKGDRVVIYLPMIAEVIPFMLGCVRIGAIHSVVFGGFASSALASRIDDASPKVIVTADAGIRGGKVVPYKPLLDEALKQIKVDRPKVVLLNRSLDKDLHMGDGDYDFATEIAKQAGANVDPVWVPSSHPSYILYTSGTTGKPKGVQRDTGGHAVAMRASMKHIYGVEPGQVMFAGSDVGWVVGHSYIVYAPLLTGATTLVYEGLPIRPDPGVWWSLVEKFKVNCLFTSPTAIRLLKKSGEEWIHKYNLSSMESLFLAGEPLDRETHRWVTSALGDAPVIDNYWQTETGWPILTNFKGLGLMETKFGSPCRPAYGFDVVLINDMTQQPAEANTKGSLMIQPPLPPGCMSTIWGDDERFVSVYFSRMKEKMYATFDSAVYDDDGYYYIMGRDDDVINVAGHRLGTREIEEALCTHPAVAEAAAIGIKDELKGQNISCFVVLTSGVEAPSEQDLKNHVAKEIGPVAKPHLVHIVNALPKTRSGKVLRRAIVAVSEGRDPGDLPTIEDASVLTRIKDAVQNK
uniref:Propionate--CoA ligase n=1 Tax=Magnetococcus massalia (strain MO-1) TaxID=451514 RepID=A0A1S7LD80_MAGMO|nr:propionyl-CoA synthetase [Candidatus Magnetococcus massalia]